MSWMIALLAFGIGIAAGMVLTYLISTDRRQASELRRELDQVNDDYSAFRKNVSEHFSDTAVAVNRLTESYREVHEQLRRGARKLCDTDAAETALAFDQSRLIGADGPAAEDAPPPAPQEPVIATTAATPEDADGGDAAKAKVAANTPPAATAVEPADEPAESVAQAATDPARPAAPAEPPRDYAEEKPPSVH